MNLFFKLLAIGGFGGTIAGAVYLSKQEYTNNHVGSGSSSEKKGPAKDVDVKGQPNTSLNPTTGSRSSQQQKVTAK